MPEKLISELIELPERVRKGDFVFNLSKGTRESAGCNRQPSLSNVAGVGVRVSCSVR